MGGPVIEATVTIAFAGAAAQAAVETTAATALHLRELEANYKLAAYRDAKNENEKGAALHVAGLLATLAEACDELGAAAATHAEDAPEDVAVDSADAPAAIEAVEQLLNDDVAGDDTAAPAT